MKKITPDFFKEYVNTTTCFRLFAMTLFLKRTNMFPIYGFLT